MKILSIPLLMLVSCLSLSSYAATEPTPEDYQAMSDALKSEKGLVAEVHGGDIEHGMFVLVWRDKKDFFKFVQLPLTGRNEEAKKILSQVHRHDVVRVKGEFDEFLERGQRHIDVDSLEIVKKFEGGYPDLPEFQHSVKLPDDLKGIKEIIAKVHAVTPDGQVLVIEYIDTIIPVIVQEKDKVKNLLKGDKIKIQFSISPYPVTPVHLMLNKGSDSLQVLKPIQSIDKQEMDTCGSLVLFVESPDIRFNVFAMESDIGDGYSWAYTLLNPDDDDIFAALRRKMQDAWDANKSGIHRGRNYYYNPQIKVCAKGQGNDEDPAQANPQIFIQQVEDLTVEVLP